MIYFSADETAQLESILIYNLSGQLILTRAYSQQLDVSELTSGLYLVKVAGNNAVSGAAKLQVIR